MQERRITRRLQKYWEHMREDKPYPLIEAIDKDDIPDLWESCFILTRSEEDPRQRLHFTHLGMEFLEIYGSGIGENAQRVYDALVDTYENAITKRAEDTIESGELLVEECDERNKDGVSIKYRLCLLPFITTPTTKKPNAVLGGMRWIGEK